MKLCKLNTTSAALLLTLSAPLVSRAQTPVIENATVNLAKSYISLAGSNFSPIGVAPTVTVGGTSRTVYSFTDSQIIVEVPSTLAAATYLATVTNSVPHSGSAYVTVATAGTVTLPFNGSGAGVTAPVFNITNTAPQYAAISGTGALALSGLNIGGTGVSGNGGPSNGGTTGVPGTGGSGIAAFGGEGTDVDDIGGSGVKKLMEATASALLGEQASLPPVETIPCRARARREATVSTHTAERERCRGVTRYLPKLAMAPISVTPVFFLATWRPLAPSTNRVAPLDRSSTRPRQ